jgi:hypothetical protein
MWDSNVPITIWLSHSTGPAWLGMSRISGGPAMYARKLSIDNMHLWGSSERFQSLKNPLTLCQWILSQTYPRAAAFWLSSSSLATRKTEIST